MSFEPSRRRPRPQRLTGPLDWSMIFRAFFVGFVAGVVTAAAWGFFGGSLSRTLDQTTSEKLLQSIWLHVLGFAIGYIPICFSAAYLSRYVEREIARHCLALGVVQFITIVAAHVMFTREPIPLSNVLFTISVVPISWGIGLWHERELS
jgi:hypothetical protein